MDPEILKGVEDLGVRSGIEMSKSYIHVHKKSQMYRLCNCFSLLFYSFLIFYLCLVSVILLVFCFLISKEGMAGGVGVVRLCK